MTELHIAHTADLGLTLRTLRSRRPSRRPLDSRSQR